MKSYRSSTNHLCHLLVPIKCFERVIITLKKINNKSLKSEKGKRPITRKFDHCRD